MKLIHFKRHVGCKILSVTLVFLHIFFFTCDGMAFAKAEKGTQKEGAVPSGKELAGTEIRDFQSQSLESLGEFKADTAESVVSSKQKTQPSTRVAASSMTTMAATQTSSSGTSAIAANFNISAIKNFSADPFSGAATFSYPIAVSPGRRGMEPALGITYSNQNNNGVCGMGWDLPLAVIERSTKRGSPKYSPEDTFIFRSAGSTIELVFIGGNEYRPKIEGAFMRFVFNGSSWIVTDKQGKKYILGSRSDSQIVSGAKTFAWYLERVEDLQGNYLVVNYFKDSNQPYVQEIKYTGFKNNEVFPSKVVFEYEDRPDRIQSFRSGFEISMKKRLKNIVVQHSGALVRKYILNYSTSNITGRSMLGFISQYYAEGQPYLPPVSFAYSQKTDAPRWALSGSWSIPHGAYFVEADRRDSAVRLSDVNADGLMDLVKSYCYHNAHNGVYFGIKQTFLNNGQNGWVLSSDWVMPEYFIADRATVIADNGVRLFDVDNDGWSDYVFSVIGDDGAPPQATRLSNKANGWVTEAPQWKLPAGVFFSRHTNWGNWPSPVLYLGLVMCDINGDGRLDVVKAYGSDRQTYLNTGAGWALTSAWAMPDGDLSNGSTTLADVNADGLIDIVIAQGTSKKVYVNNGAGWSLFSEWGIPSDVDLTQNNCQFIDVNSDGLSDIVKAPNSGEKKVYLNTSRGWVYDSAWSAFPGTMSDLGTRVEDINADGVADVLVYILNTTPKVFLGEGPYPDLLKTVNNGIGGTLDVSYVSYKGADNTVVAEKSDLPFPLQVVSEVRYNDGMGNSYPVRYQYDKAKFSFKDREFRGFGYVKTMDAEGGQSESWFKQDDIFKGRLYRQKTSDAQGHLFTMSESAWQSVVLYPGVNFPYVSTIDNYIYDGDETFKQTRTTAEYDSFGNPTKVRNEGDVSVTGDEKEVVTKYVKNEQLWLIGLPSHIIGKDSTGNTIAEKWLYYDNNSQWSDVPLLGQLTKESVWFFNPLTSDSSVLSLSYAYDIYGNLATATDPLFRTSTTTYDADYHIYPVKVTNTLNQSVEATYDVKTGQLLTSKDLNGQITQNIYDIAGRLERVVGPNDTIESPQARYEYDLAARPVKITAYTKTDDVVPSIYLESYSFLDGLGRVIQTKTEAEPDPPTLARRQIIGGTTVFNSKGLPEKQYLPYFSTYSTNYVVPDYGQPCATLLYDAVGRVLQVINPDGTLTSNAYSDWVFTVTDENGHYKMSYADAYGNIVKIEEHNQGQAYTTRYDYDAQNNLVKITDNQGNVTQVWYDSLGRKLKMNDPDMGVWLYEYDAVGNLKKQMDNKGQVLEFKYDALNRLTGKQANSQTLATYVYDDVAKENCRGRLSYIIDGSSRTNFFYDNLGREIKSEKTIGATKYSVHRTYDVLDRLISLTYPDNSAVRYSYNPQGIEKVEQIDPETQQVVKTYVSNINYSATGQINHIDYGNGTYTDYAYNPQTLRLANLKTNGGAIQNLSYQFDAVGNVKKITDDAYGSIQDFQYDDLDRLAGATGTHYGAINYTYDSIGNLLVTGDSTLSYSGANGGLRPHAVTAMSTAGGPINFEYDGNGNMIRRFSEQSGLDVNYSYDVENRLVKVMPVSQEQGEPAPASVSVTLYRGWNFISLPLVSASLHVAEALGTIALYDHYDQVSRFNSSTHKFEHYSGNPTYNQFDTMEMGRGYEIYICNEAGATLTFQGVAISQSISIDLKAGDNIIGYPYFVSMPVSEALKNLKQSVDYDTVKVYNKDDGLIALSQGDLLEPGQAYVLHALRDCSLVFEPLAQSTPQPTTEFVYDGDGGRVKKIIKTPNNQVTNVSTYIGSLYEVADGVAKKYIFAGANRIATVQSDNKTYFTHSDHLGSSNVITDDSGSVVQHLEYKPFGETALNEPANWPTGEPTDHKFTGKELDDSTGLYFYGARYYDPSIGRFVTPDTIVQAPYDPQSLNRYSYCRNNPLNYVDPTGHWFWAAIIIGAILGGASASTSHQPIWQGVLMGALGGALVAGGAAAFGFWGAAGGGMLAGAGTAGATGGNVGFGALVGGLGAGLGYGLGSWASGWNSGSFWGESGGAMFAGAVAGGVGAELSGGKFGQGAWMGAAYSSAGFLGSKTIANLDPKSQKYESEAKHRRALNVQKNDMIKIPVGSRTVVGPARHRFLPDWEMGPYKGKINTSNTVSDLLNWETHLTTQAAIKSSTAKFTTVEVSASGLVESISAYEHTWVDSGTNYMAGSCSSNYAINTVIYSAGGSVPGGIGWGPEFRSTPLYYLQNPYNDRN